MAKGRSAVASQYDHYLSMIMDAKRRESQLRMAWQVVDAEKDRNPEHAEMLKQAIEQAMALLNEEVSGLICDMALEIQRSPEHALQLWRSVSGGGR